MTTDLDPAEIDRLLRLLHFHAPQVLVTADEKHLVAVLEILDQARQQLRVPLVFRRVGRDRYDIGTGTPAALPELAWLAHLVLDAVHAGAGIDSVRLAADFAIRPDARHPDRQLRRGRERLASTLESLGAQRLAAEVRQIKVARDCSIRYEPRARVVTR